MCVSGSLECVCVCVSGSLQCVCVSYVFIPMEFRFVLVFGLLGCHFPLSLLDVGDLRGVQSVLWILDMAFLPTLPFLD